MRSARTCRAPRTRSSPGTGSSRASSSWSTRSSALTTTTVTTRCQTSSGAHAAKRSASGCTSTSSRTRCLRSRASGGATAAAGATTCARACRRCVRPNWRASTQDDAPRVPCKTAPSTRVADAPAVFSGAMERQDLAAELRRVARTLRDQAWIVAVCVLVGLAAAALYSSSKSTTYQAQSKVLLLQDDPNATLSGNAVFLDPVRQRATALDLITGPNVAARARRQLRTSRPLPAVHANANGDSNVVTIFAESGRPVLTARTADAYAKQYVEFRCDAVRARYEQGLSDVNNRIKRLQSTQPPGYQAQLAELRRQSQQLSLLATTRLPDATVIQKANGFAYELPKHTLRDLLLGAIAGLLIGLLLAFVRERLDDRVKTEEDVANVLSGVPVLATVPRWRPGSRWRREAAEGYNNLGVSVRSLNGRTASSYLVTSAVGEDGKSTTALNLSLALG